MMAWDCPAPGEAGAALAGPTAEETAAATPTSDKSTAGRIRQQRRTKTDSLIAAGVHLIAAAYPMSTGIARLRFHSGSPTKHCTREARDLTDHGRRETSLWRPRGRRTKSFAFV